MQKITIFIKQNSYLFLILIVALFLLTFSLNKNLMFIGDFGWYYIHARDMLLTGHIPLVSIASSHPWLHQGPYWTYLLGIALFLGRFNPMAGAYLATSIALITVISLYFVTKEMFGKTVASIAALFFSTSPLVLIHMRMPYGTMPIALCTTMYLFFFYKMLRGDKFSLVGVILSLVALYNFELATTVLIAPILFFIALGIYKKQAWIKKVFNKKSVIYAIVGGLVAFSPILLYDLTHGFPQTFKFIIWIGYRLLLFLKIVSPVSVSPPNDAPPPLVFAGQMVQRLFFLPNLQVALILLTGLLVMSFIILFKKIKQKNIKNSDIVIAVSFFVTLAGYVLNGTPSEAYVPVLFPFFAILCGIVLQNFRKVRYFNFLLGLFIGICIVNAYTLVSQNYLLNKEGYGYTFTEREAVADKIVKSSRGEELSLKGKGFPARFESFTMNYEYLVWYRGGKVVKNSENVFTIQESPDKIEVSHD